MVACTSFQQQLIQYYLSLSASVLSCLGSALTLLIYLRFKSLQIFAFRLVAILALFDMGLSIGFFLPTYSGDNHSICIVQAALISAFSLADVLWTGIISLTLYSVVVGEQRPRGWLRSLPVLVPVVSVVAAGLPFTTESYGLTTGLCWVDHSNAVGVYWSLAIFYGPLSATILANVASYVAILTSQLRASTEAANSKRKLVIRLVSYPLVLVVCFTPIAAARVYEFCGYCPPSELYYLAMTLAPSVGFWNFLVYGFNKNVRSTVRNWHRSPQDSLLSVPDSALFLLPD